MEDRVIHFRVGMFVAIVATALMCLFMVYLFGELPNGRTKTLFVRFDDVTGVSGQTPVRKNGILIGRVRELKPVEDGVVLAIAIDDRWKVFESEVCRIATDNLFGDAYLEFTGSGVKGASNREIQHGEYMNGTVASRPMDAMSMVVDMKEEFRDAIVSIRSAGEQVAVVAENMSLLVADNQQQFSRVLGKTEKALGRFDTAMVAVNQFVGDEDLQYALEDALQGVPTLVNNAGNVLSTVQKVLDSAEANLENIRGFTEPLGDQGDTIVNKLNTSAGRLDELLVEFQRFGQQLNNGEGTVGQLVHNPELYQNLNRAARNIEELTRQLRPIVNDARVAVDKVARNPGIIGVQGALQRRNSGIK